MGPKKDLKENRRFTQASTFLVDEVDPYLDTSGDVGHHDTDTSSEDNKMRGKNLFRLSSWTREIVNLALATGILVAMFITLGMYDNQVAPDWSINVNTIVSILTAILRACMLFVLANVIGQAKWAWFDQTRPLAHLERFDNASRGLFGSLQLLFTAPGNALALVSTLLTIAAAAVGPFAQQAVKSVACQQVVPGENATVPVTNFVYPVRYDGVYRTGAGTYDIGYSLKGNLLNGLANVSDNAVTATCSTGNCTFAAHGGVTYSSMGVCSKCLDTSAHINKTQSEGAQAGYGYNFSLPNDLYVTPFENRYLAIAGDADFSKADLAAADPAAYNATFAELSVLSFLGNYTTAYAEALSVSCMLYACLKNYHGSVEAGDLREDVVEEVPAQVVSSLLGNFSVVKEPCWLEDVAYDRTNFSFLTTSSPRPDNSTGAYAFETVLLKDDDNDTTGRNYSVPLECLYTLPGSTASALRAYMYPTLFQGECFYWSGTSTALDCGDEWWLEPLQQHGNASLASVAGIVANMATAATNLFRPVGSSLYYDEWWGKTAAVALGRAYKTEVCVRFEWRWLVLPACLVAASALLLAATVLADGLSRRRRPIWKSSLLPLLYYGFARPPAVGLDRAVDARHLDAKSSKMPVHLSTMDGSVGFMVDSKHT